MSIASLWAAGVSAVERKNCAGVSGFSISLSVSKFCGEIK
jgi:hypothetical protein